MFVIYHTAIPVTGRPCSSDRSGAADEPSTRTVTIEVAERRTTRILPMLRTRRALLAGLLVAVAVSLGFALSAVPNVELVSFTVFVSGFLLGPMYGAVVGAASAALFSSMNPLGAALPPITLAQVAGQCVVGLAGGCIGPVVTRPASRFGSCVIAGAAGLALTLCYDVLTSAGAYITIAGAKSLEGLVKFIAAGILFVGLHIVWNTALFSAALAPTLRVLERFRGELKGR